MKNTAVTKSRKDLFPAIAAFLLMMAMSVSTSALSFFVTPVSDALAVSRGSFTMYYSILTLTGAFGISFIGQYINKKGARGIVLLSGLWVSAGFLLLSVSGALWHFYVIAAPMGLFCSSCVNLCANVVVQQSYTKERASGLLGIVMAGSGVGGMLLSMILPGMLENFGWRTGYRFLGVCWLMLTLCAWFLMGNRGAAAAEKAFPGQEDGMSRAEALKDKRFYLITFSVVIYMMCCSIQQQIPSLLTGMDFSASSVSIMTSILTAGLAVGKIAQGFLYGKIGIKKGGILLSLMYAAGYLLLLNPSTVYPGLICLSFGMGTLTTLMPTAARNVFGAGQFAAIWSVISTASCIGSFVANPIWGSVYDIFGSYTPALLVSPVLILAGLAALLTALRPPKV